MVGIEENLRLGVFDINGTIHTDSSGISEQVRTGFENLRTQAIDSTIITGRSIKRANELLGTGWDTVVSPGVPISVENGSRLVSADNRNIRHYPLTNDEITAAIDGIELAGSQVQYLAYHPQNPDSSAVLWTLKPETVTDFQSGHGHHGELLSASLSQFAARLTLDRASMVIVGVDSMDVETAFSNSNVVANGVELNVLGTGIDKAKGVEDIVEVTGVPMSEILVAGNDSNDLKMLDLPAGQKIFVDGLGLTVSLDIRVLPSPNSLGEYLQSIRNNRSLV